MAKKLTTEEVVKQFRKVHGDLYDYSLVDYKGNKIKVKIICPLHGEFEQTPDGHKNGQGCPKCNGGISLNTEEVIEQFKKVHGELYDYSLVDYVNDKTNVTILCPEHGEFEQTPNSHKSGQGCPRCAKNCKLTLEEIIEQLKKVHGEFYDYSLVELDYINDKTNVTILCPEHGEFEQTPNNHKTGQGCPKCGQIKRSESNTYTTEEVIEQFKKVHGEFYIYDLVEYIGDEVKVKIICPIHDIFEQTPHAHKNGQGCPDCAEHGYRDNHEDGGSFYLYLRSDGYGKFGKTHRDVETRVRQACEGVTFKIIGIEHNVDASMASYIESKIKADKSLVTNQAKLDGEYFDGYTETVSLENIDALIMLAKKYRKEWLNLKLKE